MVFSGSVISAAKAHALKAYPEESVGLVIKGKYRAVKNISETPHLNFRIAAKEIKSAKKEGLEGVIHSHPDATHYPSQADMQGQLLNAVPWAIINVDNGEVSDYFEWGHASIMEVDLLGRPFRHGVTDCYSIIRDYYWQTYKILLSEYPRDWEWWKDEDDLYETGFRKEGFRIIDQSEVRAGDAFLATVASDKINHAGIYLGNGLILHQLGSRHGYAPDRLSCRTPFANWERTVNYWVRHGTLD